MILDETVVREVTDDFCSVFETDEDYRGIFARLTADVLPECVDPEDERVVAIVERCRKERATVCDTFEEVT